MSMVVAIGGSFGAMQVLLKIVSALGRDFAGTLLVVTHIGAKESALPEILAKVSWLPVRSARDGERIVAGTILVAPADRHMLVGEDGGTIRLYHGPKENYTRPAIDPLFRSVAAAFGPGAVGVLLTGYLDDGVAGLQAIKSQGGQVIVQEPTTAAARSMPCLALDHVVVDLVLSPDEIGPRLCELAAGRQGRPTAAPGTDPLSPAGKDSQNASTWLALENRMSAGTAGMSALARIATPSTYTCPECHGTLWQLRGEGITRFRCHTGHAYTAHILRRSQSDAVEEALWAALRALQERESLLLELGRRAPAGDHQQDLARQLATVTRRAATLRGMLDVTPDAGGQEPDSGCD